MKVKRFKVSLSDVIVGMTLEQAKGVCLNEGYVLRTSDIHNSMDDMCDTYFITVNEIDSDGKILNAKYGK